MSCFGFLRGWSRNDKGNFFRVKNEMIFELHTLDAAGHQGLLLEEGWKQRYTGEEKLSKIYAEEEVYWQWRDGAWWLLQCDNNTAFFHSVANGRRRKTSILSLEDEGLIIEDDVMLHNHVNEYYRMLFGKEHVSPVKINSDTSRNEGRISEEESIELSKPFLMDKKERAVKYLKTNTAPGPDGFLVQFIRNFGHKSGGSIKEMFDELHAGRLDMGRLNYGVIILLPKVVDAHVIKQF